MRVTAHGISRLNEEHEGLRASLGVIEYAMEQPLQPDTWGVARAACVALAPRLQRHLRRETALVASCQARRRILGSTELAAFAVEHHRYHEVLQVLKRCLMKDGSQGAVEDLRPLLSQLVSGLRSQMQEQEAQLYPFMLRVIAERPQREPVRPLSRPAIAASS